jgi:polyhydroxyalkanoate synthesis repressor PhaR
MVTQRRSEQPGADSAQSTAAVRVLKKYPNRRLYDTRTSSYITLADVKQMVLGSEDFEVRDAKTGEDLTRSILLQIILEEESGGVPMFTAQTLAQIIRFYGHAMQGVMGSMLEQNMANFTQLQKQFFEQSTKFTPDLWSQFLRGQPGLMQSLMDSYVEQGRTMLESLQRFPGMPGFPPAKK